MNKQITCELVDSMGSDLSTVNAARVSFNKQKEEMDGGDVKLIRYLADHKHMTPFRHNAIQLRCKAPIFLARQLGKHQAGLSWNEVSRRYIDSEPEFYEPTEWRAKPSGSIKQGSEGTVDLTLHADDGEHIDITVVRQGIEPDSTRYIPEWSLEDQLDDVMDNINRLYKGLLAADIAPEMARMVLPQSMLTEWVWTGNLLAFAHVYKERMAEGAQLEAQMFAKELDGIIRPLFPESWSALVDD
jgi:thymidylate synthase (FAD)